jgi:tetratricopeptide (TPR) repeat protein
MELRGKFLLGIFGALVIAAAVLARPGYRAFKGWRAERLAGEADAAIARESWPEASQKAQAAYQLDPMNPKVIRVVARLYSLAGHPNALTFWENLRATGRTTVEDRRELVRSGMRLGKSALVRDEVFRLANAQPPELANLRLAAEFFMVTGDRTNALVYARALAGLAKNADGELVLAQALVASGGSAEVAQARGMLNRLAALTNAVGLEAQVVLARAGLVSDENLPRLIDAIMKHPEAKLPHRLLAEELRLRLRPQDRAESVTMFATEFASAAMTNRVEVGRWLNRQKEFARTVELLPAGDAAKNRDAFLARMDALAALGRWKDVEGELAAEAVPVEGALKQLFLARAARELKKLPEADAHWRRVQLELSSQPEAMFYVADYAERVGEFEEARKAYERLAALPEYADRAFTGLIRLAEASGGTRTLREIMRDLSARRPDDPAPANDYAYLNLLLNERVEAAKEAAQKLYDAHPNVLAYRVTLALAHLRLDQAAKARELLDVDVDWVKVRPGWQAVHAAVRAANGQNDLARALARQIALAKLKPEERELIATLL